MASELPISDGIDVEPGKLFVGALSWDTNKVSLERYFSKYGELEDCTVMVNPTGQPRGFGFVKFKNPEDTKVVLSVQEHYLDGKKIDPKPATKNNPNVVRNGSVKSTTAKVFVGGISPHTSKDDIMAAFCQFGEISQLNNGVEIKIDPNTNKPRGFGFVTFVAKESADKAVAQKWVTINDKQVEVKVAENPKPRTPGVFNERMGYGRVGAGGGAAAYSGYAAHGYQQDTRHMAQQTSSYYSQPFSGQYPYSGYNQASGGYTNGSGTYPMYGQGSSGHGQGYDGYSGYGASRESGYPQQYNFSQQQQQQTPYAGSQASHTGGYGHSQQAYNGYPVHQ